MHKESGHNKPNLGGSFAGYGFLLAVLAVIVTPWDFSFLRLVQNIVAVGLSLLLLRMSYSLRGQLASLQPQPQVGLLHNPIIVTLLVVGLAFASGAYFSYRVLSSEVSVSSVESVESVDKNSYKGDGQPAPGEAKVVKTTPTATKDEVSKIATPTPLGWNLYPEQDAAQTGDSFCSISDRWVRRGFYANCDILSQVNARRNLRPGDKVIVFGPTGGDGVIDPEKPQRQEIVETVGRAMYEMADSHQDSVAVQQFRSLVDSVVVDQVHEKLRLYSAELCEGLEDCRMRAIDFPAQPAIKIDGVTSYIGIALVFTFQGRFQGLVRFFDQTMLLFVGAAPGSSTSGLKINQISHSSGKRQDLRAP